MTVIWVSHFPIPILPASSLVTLAVNKLNFSTVCAAIPAMNLVYRQTGCPLQRVGNRCDTKTIVFSNALDFTKALDIQEYCKNKIRCSFGIGTNLTNDTGFEPSNIVMKLTQCKMNVNQEWRECVKLSDDAGKHIGSEAEVRACLYDLRLGQQIEPLC